MRKLLLLLMVFSLTACAHVVSKEMRQKTGVAPPTERLFSHPEDYTGRTVILGGYIANTTNAEDATYVEVVEAPLDSRGNPGSADKSSGRFLVKSRRYLDPAVYAQGRRLTVAGEVEGTRPGRVGDAPYNYLLINGREFHLIKDSDGGPRFHIGVGVFHSF
jgi:outer membrane lipoprotein